jgi:hypothetical protein
MALINSCYDKMGFGSEYDTRVPDFLAHEPSLLCNGLRVRRVRLTPVMTGVESRG